MANPFFAPSTLPYQLPPFAEILDEHYAPAFERGFQEQLDEVQAIIDNDEPPTFDNTIAALERSGGTLDRVAHVFYNRSSADADDFVQELETEISPRYAAHTDAIVLNPALFARVDAVFASRDEQDWTPEQRYLVERRHTEFRLAGAGLDESSTTRLKALNQRIATLTTQFDKQLLADTNDLAVHIVDAAQLDGLSEGELGAAEAAAKERGLDEGYLVTLPLYTGHPWLASIRDRATRERIMTASLARGRRGNENDNNEIVRELTTLRAERAALLGFPNHAAYVTVDETAGSPEAVAEMLDALAPRAAANVQRELEALREVAGHEIAAWDWAFYTEQVRARDYDIDTQALRPWFESERVLWDGVFAAATLAYGVQFTERPDLVAYHPDARVFEVHDEDGGPVGLYVLDLYTRDSKRGGAWMNPLISQNALLDQPVVVVNNLNVPKPPEGSPTLLTFDETNTLFHEFGHALHGLFARVTYPSFAGTNVHRDFVEFPSQVNEMWMLWPGIVDNYARHVETGEPLPDGVIDRLAASETFNQGHDTAEYLAAALLDQALHTVTEDAPIDDVQAFERAALERVGLSIPEVPTRYSSTYFQHIFAGGYSAGYYSYIWSEVLDADTVELFKEPGADVRALGQRFRERLLGVGGSKPPLDAYRDFRGRDAELAPLLRRRGLEATDAAD